MISLVVHALIVLWGRDSQAYLVHSRVWPAGLHYRWMSRMVHSSRHELSQILSWSPYSRDKCFALSYSSRVVDTLGQPVKMEKFRRENFKIERPAKALSRGKHFLRHPLR